MDHRYRGNLKFEEGYVYKNFQVKQCEPKPAKLGIGPYCVYYKGQLVKQEKYHGDCKYWIEELVNDHRQVTREIQKLQSEFIEKWQLPDFPEDL